jgi:hypothetical protein
MNKKITLLVLLCISFSTLISQEKIKGNKNITTVKTDLKAFSKVVIQNDFKVNLQKSDSPAVEIETDENIHDAIIVSEMNETLTISTSKKIRASKKLLITIHYNQPLEVLTVKDDAEVASVTTLKTPNFTLNIDDYAKAELTIQSDDFTLKNGNKSRIPLRSKSKLTVDSKKAHLFFNESSNTDLAINNDSLKVIMSDRSTVNISGTVNFLEATTSDSSDFEGKDLNVKSVETTVKGSSNFVIMAIDSINLNASEKGKTEVYGSPKITLSKFTDTSKLFKKEL